MTPFTRASILMMLLGCGAAMAAGGKTSEAQLRYQQDRKLCMSGASNQDRATCLKEAGAALQEAKRNSLGASGESELAQNRLSRCNGLPAQDREDCARRMSGEGSTTGSAQQGGISRELVRTVN